ncbi:hypothetical protein [Pseudomonas massiliensis]|uniref:hypothetical protein n=1 Tax=Pseudomonas massiliensis TaxID=522492 RepID=UPI000590F2AB|nr:hypothetical protein [Pseudomonas massiliensis]
MIRITGTLGQWPVDLCIEMGEGDWARLQGVLQITPADEAHALERPASPTPQAAAASDTLWDSALALVEASGQISGPALFEQLEGLAGSAQAGKRLLVRLRHCSQVRVLSGADAPLYTWAGQ